MNRGAFAAVVRDGEVLLVRSRTAPQFRDHWSLPGGIVEPGESWQDGAGREVLEETSIVCTVKDFIVEVDNVEDNIQVQIFRAEYQSGNIVIDPEEIAEAAWFSIASAQKLPLAYNTADILQAL